MQIASSFFASGVGEDPGGQLIGWIEKFLTDWLRLQFYEKLKLQFDYVLTTTLEILSKWHHFEPAAFFFFFNNIKIGMVWSTQCYLTEKSSFAWVKQKAKHGNSGHLQRERYIAKGPSKETKGGLKSVSPDWG